MICIARLGPDSASEYSQWTFPKYRSIVERCDSPSVVAVGARFWGKPAGLCLASLNNGTGQSWLLSICADLEYRRRGIGSALLLAAERELMARGATSTKAAYLSDWPNSPVLERLLRQSGWEICREAIVFRGRVTPARAAVVTHSLSNARLSPGCEISAWSDVSPGERIALAANQSELGYPDGLSPFVDEPSIAPNSIVLRCRGAIAGWHITHRVLPDQLRYSRVFVREDLRSAGQGCALIREVVRRHSESPLAQQAPRCFFHVSIHNPQMLKLIDKRIRAVLDSSAVAYEAVKKLPIPN